MISATIFGRLTKEPETSVTKGGTQICNITIAVNHGKDAQGVEQSTFVDLAAFGKTIEALANYCHKGTRVCVSADLRLRKYTKQNGEAGAALEGSIARVDIIDWPEQQQVAAPTPQAAPYPPYTGAAAPQAQQPYPQVQQPYPQPSGQYPGYVPPVAPSAQSAPTPYAPIPGASTTAPWTPGGPADFPFGSNAQR